MNLPLLLCTAALLAAPAFDARRIALQRVEFDPLAAPPSPRWRQANTPPDAVVPTLIQFYGPVSGETYAALERACAGVIGPVPHHAFLVAAAPRQRAALAALPGARWVGDYHPDYKLRADLEARARAAPRGDETRLRVVAQLAPAIAPLETTLAAIAALGGATVALRPMPTFATVQLELPARRSEEVAALPGVLWLEPAPEFALFGERAAQLQAGALTPDAVCAAGPGYADLLADWGVTGAGVVVQVLDSGADLGVLGTGHPDLFDALSGHFAATGDGTAGDFGGHGTINAGIIAGRAATGMRDAHGFLLGQGVAPGARVFNTKIFDEFDAFDIGFHTLTDLAQLGYLHGARVSSNSWGCPGCDNTYIGTSQEIDYLTRDADIEAPGNQQMLYVFAAGNSGPGLGSVRPPGTAKNDITVGAAENCDDDGTDGCSLAPGYSDRATDLAPFSSRGPAADNRLEPTLVSVGTHVAGPASTLPGYRGSGVCDKYWPAGQTLYARSSGTSHSAPLVAGAAALYIERHTQWTGVAPSPAMIKAALIDACESLSGASGDGGRLSPAPEPRQGWGRPNLQRLLSADTARVRRDQDTLFTESGQAFILEIAPADVAQPLTITLVWTDAPGMLWNRLTLVNNLDLEVETPDGLLLGNRIEQGASAAGGGADWQNNVERVVIPAPRPARHRVRVIARELAGDGVPGNAAPLDQDFALLIANAVEVTAAAVSLDRSLYACDSPVQLTVVDAARGALDEVGATLRNLNSAAAVAVALHADAVGSNVYTARLPALSAVLSVADGDIVALDYDDAGVIGRATAAVDCRPPEISDLRLLSVGDDRALVAWRADEPVIGAARAGEACGPAAAVASRAAANREHVALLTGLQPLSRYIVTAQAADRAGNRAPNDGDAHCLALFTAGRGTAFAADVDDGTAAWTAMPPWEVARENGNAYWSLGRIESRLVPPFSASLVAPPISLAGMTGARLEFLTRHFFAYSDPQGLVEASTDGVNWSPRLHVSRGVRAEWHRARVDLSAYDQAPAVYLRFRARTVAERLNGGWHIDAVRVFAARPRDGAAWLSLGKDVYACGDNAMITLVDAASVGRSAVAVRAVSRDGGDEELVALAADEAQPDLFSGSVTLTTEAPAADGRLSVVHGDAVIVTLPDVAAPSATAAVRCAAPLLTRVTPITANPDGFVLSWQTDTVTRGEVLLGDACDSLNIAATSIAAGTQHTVTLAGLSPDRYYRLAVRATDVAGNVTVSDCREARTATSTPLLTEAMPDGIDGWTAQPPWGRTRERAFSGDSCWTDSPYRFTPRRIDAALISPLLDLRGTRRPRLSFAHTHDLDDDGAYLGVVELSTDGGATYAATPALEVRGRRSEWKRESVDLTPLAQTAQARVRLRLYEVRPGVDIVDGWYVDDLRVSDDYVRDGRGELKLDRAAYPCAGTATVTLYDTDLRGAGAAAVAVNGAPVTVFEAPPASGIFHAELPLPPLHHGDTLTARYADASPPRLVEATAAIDCDAPVVALNAVAIFDRAARLEFAVAEPLDVTVSYGAECGADDTSVSAYARAATHALWLTRLEPDTRYQVRVAAVDAAGNVGAASGGLCHSFVTPPAAEVLLNEISFGAPRGVELQHRGAVATHLAGWSLPWTSGNGGGRFDFPDNVLVPAGGRLVVLVGNQEDAPTALYRGNFGWNVLQPGSLALLDARGRGVDFVRWNGSAAAPPAGTRWLPPEIPLGQVAAADLGRAPDAPDTDSGADWYPVRAALGEPNDIRTPTPTATPTISPTPNEQDTVLETFLEYGDPLAANSEFEIGLRLRNNRVAPVGTYWVELLYDAEAAEVRSVRDGGLGGIFTFNRHQRGAVNLLGVNSSSTLADGVLFYVAFRTRAQRPPSYGITARNFGDNELVAITFAKIPAVYDSHATQFVQGTPTETPTGPTPTFTPTRTPSPTATATETPDPRGARLISELVSGDPCAVGAVIELGVRLEGNAVGRVGSYAVALVHSLAQLRYLDARDGGDGFGVGPATGQVRLPSGEDARAFSAFNAVSLFRNGRLMIARFEVLAAPAHYDVELRDYGPSGLVTTSFVTIPHTLEWDATRFCRTDSDGDGLWDDVEDANPPRAGRSNRVLPDSDGDGLPDGAEDRNGNGARDAGETGTRLFDSDGDMVGDGVEVLLLGTNPLDPSTPAGAVDADRDRLPAPLDADDGNPDVDGDRYADGYEAVQLDLAAAGDALRHPRLGDLNDDGEAGNADALIAQAFFLRLSAAGAPSVRLERGDASVDGAVTNVDALILQAFGLGTARRLPLRANEGTR